MKVKWVVTVTKPMDRDDFREGFFPRKLYYKRDAEALAREVRAKGGEASVDKEKK